MASKKVRKPVPIGRRTRKAAHRSAYAGDSMDDDLRSALKRLAERLEDAIAMAPKKASTAAGTWNVAVPRNQLRDAARIIRRAASLPSIAPLFPEQLSHRQTSGHRYWMAVEALLDGGNVEANRNLAKRWQCKPTTIEKALGDLRMHAEDEVRNWQSEDTSLARLREYISERRAQYLHRKGQLT